MKSIVIGTVLAVAAGTVTWRCENAWGERTARRIAEGALELALQYDFFVFDGQRVEDASRYKHDGDLKRGEIVNGRRKPAIKLDGNGSISLAETPDSLDPASRPFAIGALCRPAAADGVIAAMGGRTNGFSLYVREGVPRFAVRAGGQLWEVSDDDALPIDQWVHLVGTVDERGELWLIVNGWPVAHAQGKLIPQKPAEPLSVGADCGEAVTDYPAPLGWQGLLEDVRLYWGFLDRNEHREALADWADLPGCGCRK
jgi:hypothetical protein